MQPDWISNAGYQYAAERGLAGFCAVRTRLYTAALVVGIDPIGHCGRYCYESLELARFALDCWDGSGDPPGPWIKYKSATCERLGPGALTDFAG